MSLFNKTLNQPNNDCCRECSGNICASFRITDVQNIGEEEIISFSLFHSDIQKSCNKNLTNEGNEAVKQELNGLASNAFQQYINALSTIGNYYVEVGQTYKLCASFSLDICFENGAPTITIKDFTVQSTS